MLRELVEELLRVLLTLEKIRNTHSLLPYLFIIATLATAFTPSLHVALFFITVGALAAWRGGGLKTWFTAVSASAFSAGLISLPAVIGLLPSKVDPVLFVARTVSAVAVVAGGLVYCGWIQFVKVFNYLLLREVSRMLELFPPFLYSFGRTAIAVVAAKEARSPYFDKKAYVAAIGDILIYGIERGRNLRMAYEARSP